MILPLPLRSSRWVIGLGLHDAVRHAVPTLPRERVAAFVERYRVHYLRRDAELNVFEGVPELLRGLDAAGVPLAVATGKSRAGLDRALAQTGLGPRFAATRCADEGAPKPDPWMLRDLGQVLQVPPQRAVAMALTAASVCASGTVGSLLRKMLNRPSRYCRVSLRAITVTSLFPPLCSIVMSS